MFGEIRKLWYMLYNMESWNDYCTAFYNERLHYYKLLFCKSLTEELYYRFVHV